ncbi:MAG: hypothetical protein HY738_01145 [Bacteroidia bacterium]|nr:hypothetical protein [Bacteroidia bacterium]
MKKVKTNIDNNTDMNEYFVIPNPIYDVVFKYLMEDNESAIIILSTLINEKIKSLKFEPVSKTEKITDPKTDKEIKLFHLDFTATIELSDGTEELIMIEIQKANRASDIFRFKRYISANFQRKQEKEIINPKTQAVEKIDKPIRLIPIFILNFRIENEIDDLIIRTKRLKVGIFKEKNLQKQNEFIDNLSYDIWVVQLPNLPKIEKTEYENDDYKTKLYLLFNLFDQKAKIKENRHRLLLLRKKFPGFLERIINRLKSADANNPDLEEQMHIEDEYLNELNKMHNEISWFKEQLENEKNINKEKDKALNEKDKALNEKDKLIYNLAKMLKENGMPINEIHLKTGLPIIEIEKI